MTDTQTTTLQRIARKVASSFVNRPWVRFAGMTTDDLVQCAFIGALRAHRTFDSRRGNYETWVKVCVGGEIRHAFRSNFGGLIRVPRPQGAEKWPSPYQFFPLQDESIAFDGIDRNGHDEGHGLINALRDETTDVEGGRILCDLLGRLPRREGQLLWLYHIVGMTQTELARIFCISQRHVSRLLCDGARDLRQMMV